MVFMGNFRNNFTMDTVQQFIENSLSFDIQLRILEEAHRSDINLVNFIDIFEVYKYSGRTHTQLNELRYGILIDSIRSDRPDLTEYLFGYLSLSNYSVDQVVHLFDTIYYSKVGDETAYINKLLEDEMFAECTDTIIVKQLFNIALKHAKLGLIKGLFQHSGYCGDPNSLDILIEGVGSGYKASEQLEVIKYLVQHGYDSRSDEIIIGKLANICGIDSNYNDNLEYLISLEYFVSDDTLKYLAKHESLKYLFIDAVSLKSELSMSVYKSSIVDGTEGIIRWLFGDDIHIRPEDDSKITGWGVLAENKNVFKMLVDCGYKLNSYTVYCAGYIKSYELLHSLLDDYQCSSLSDVYIGVMLDLSEFCDSSGIAPCKPDMNLLGLLKENRCPVDNNVTFMMCSFGFIEAFRWAMYSGFPYNADECKTVALNNNHIHIVNFIDELNAVD